MPTWPESGATEERSARNASGWPSGPYWFSDGVVTALLSYDGTCWLQWFGDHWDYSELVSSKNWEREVEHLNFIHRPALGQWPNR